METLKEQINQKHLANVKSVSEAILEKLGELETGRFQNEITLEITYYAAGARIRYEDEFELYVLQNSKRDYCQRVLHEVCVELSSTIGTDVVFENGIKIPALI